MTQPTLASREKLLDLLIRITKQSSLPPSLKKSRFVRVPADLITEAQVVIMNEMDAIAALMPPESQ